MKEEDFEEDGGLFEEEFVENYSNDLDIENEEEYLRMLAENGEGLLMGEDDEAVLDDSDNDIVDDIDFEDSDIF
ncbi:MAG: hypothetical protein M0Q13_07095 [Methanothrix sp.]|jgi:hypothetical protein|nr:hypothetical protein [Methanothrix sp.]